MSSSLSICDQLREELTREMRTSPEGAITFARFMEQSLYHPRLGYYSRGQVSFGRQGDFFTNIQTGPLFAQALATFIFNYWCQLGKPTDWCLVEVGAGSGQLMYQIFHHLLGRKAVPPQLIIMEISPALRRQQQQLLQDTPVRWLEDLTELTSLSPTIVYSNELIDAMPIHRLRKDHAGNWQEIYVTTDGNSYHESLGPVSAPELERHVADWPYVPSGQTIDVNLRALNWLQQMAAWLKTGLLLTIDYGGMYNDLLARYDGTVRYYRGHRLQNDPYQYLGETDITSHVNFEQLITYGQQVGFTDYKLVTQSQFLLDADILSLLSAGECDPFSHEAKQRRMLLQLVHPAAMGEIFQVLLQVKGVALPDNVKYKEMV